MSNLLRKNCVLIHFDADLATESHARPNYRPPPMTECLAKKLIYAALAGRGAKAVKTNSEPDCPIPGDVLCILDGGRDSPALMSPFKQGKGLTDSLTDYSVDYYSGISSLFYSKFKFESRRPSPALP